jgi:hypothetical protein
MSDQSPLTQTTMPRFTKFALGAALCAFVACGDDSSGPSTPVDMTGTWTSNGTLSTGEAFILSMVLTSAETNVTGSGQVIGIANGSITGTTDGNKFTFQFALTQPCVATLSGTETVSGRSINGTLGGTSQCLGTVQASFSGARLQEQ